MAFDGITIATIVKECNNQIVGGRIVKIAQPEQDELLLTLKNNGMQYRLIISVNASLPLVYFTTKNKPSPLTAPNFCMLLRKHLQNGRILSVQQPDFERIIRIEIQHLNELGDVCIKYLVVEMMGKHSNIMLLNHKEVIIDSVKHISGMVSSLREVLPGRSYFVPVAQEKYNPLEMTRETFIEVIHGVEKPVYQAIYCGLTGISPIIAKECCHRANIQSDCIVSLLDQESIEKLADVVISLMEDIKKGAFISCIYYDGIQPIEYASITLTIYETNRSSSYQAISELLESYYKEKSIVTRIRQKSSDLRHVVQVAMERNKKKYTLQKKQLEDTNQKETYRIYGELLNTYGYGIDAGEKSIEVLNYYEDKKMKIPLDSQLTPIENAKKYFDKYGKLKRTHEALTTLTEETYAEILHLESISNALDIAVKEEDLVEIKEELMQSGYIRRKYHHKKEKITSKPFHYKSSDGDDIYIGKNNLQNEELTFRFATGNDWWFHTKGIPGSHVIVKVTGEELSDRTFEEAAALAAYYSKGRGQEKVEIDYTRKKNVKKPSGGKLGFVVYYTNYSMIASSNIEGLEEV
ncbi:MAG: NFACT RNA binding domain-containing protein [Eubacteriales bacterium]